MKRFTQYKNYRWIMYLIIFAMLAGPQITHLTKVAYAAVFNTGVVADNVTDQCDLRIEQTSNGIGVWNPRAIERNGFDAETMVESLMVPEWYLDSWNPGPGESHNALIADVGQLYEVNCSTPANGGTGSGVAGNAQVRDVRPYIGTVNYDEASDTTTIQIEFPTTLISTDVTQHNAAWYNPAGTSPDLHSIDTDTADRDSDGIADTTWVQYRWHGDHAANFSFIARYDGGTGESLYAMWQRNDMTRLDGELDVSSWGPDNPNGAIMPAMDPGEQIMFTPATQTDPIVASPTGQIQYLFLPTIMQQLGQTAGATIPQQ